MQRSELIRFAIGTAFTDLTLSALIILVPIVWVGENISAHTIDLSFGGDGSTLTVQDFFPLGSVILFSTLSTFGISLLLAWYMTRKLPRQA